MPEPEHWLDGVADDLKDWMDSEVQYHVEAMRGGYRSPFSADVSEQDKVEYYRRQMYTANPDGSIDYSKPNAQGRDRLLKRDGVRIYAEIYDAVKPKQGRRPILEAPIEPEMTGQPDEQGQ